MSSNYERMLDLYPLLIESAIDFKIESRKILAAHNGKSLFTFILFRREFVAQFLISPQIVSYFNKQLFSGLKVLT